MDQIAATGTRPYRQVLELLRGVGLRPTRQRLALARMLFEGEDRHVTAEILHAEALGAKVSVSLATVYNTLHQFTNTGLLREIVVDASRSYFDTNTTQHHHFFLEGSGHLQDIPGERLPLADLPPPPPGTSVKRVDIIIRLKEE
jgi:Fur family iron response transcriptional regulator